MDTKYYYMMGLPASGKTTFLVAFTYMLLEQTEKVCLHMKPQDVQEGLTEEFKKEIERWTNFESLHHTGVGQVHKMKYTLYDADGVRYILEVPDRSGETFDAIIRDRYIDDNTMGDWLRADEILFFINLERMNVGDKESLLTELPPSVLAYWYLVKYFWLLLPFYDTIKETAVISYGKTKKVQNQTYG